MLLLQVTASNSQGPVNGWDPELTKLGYSEPLPAPSPAVQATLATISANEIHSYIQDADRTAFEDKDEDGEHAPMMISTLDLSHWTAIMFTAAENTEQGLAKLMQAHSVLSTILERDEKDLEEAEFHTRAVEAALKATNPHETWSNESASIPTVPLDGTSSSPSAMHPLLSRLNIAQAHQAAIEELSESITYTQTEANHAALEASGRGPAIPFLPARAVEDQLNTKSHRTWCLNNINLMAPITIPMWKIWAYLSDQEVKRCEERALNCENLLREPIILSNAFPLALFDHHKCNTTKIQVLAKQNVMTVNPCVKKYTSTFWNCQRPYIRCMCDQAATTGCKGTMLWFDHAIWFILNNLERFFDSTYPTLTAKYGAFITWLICPLVIFVFLQNGLVLLLARKPCAVKSSDSLDHPSM
jgi:hypothetical protein